MNILLPDSPRPGRDMPPIGTEDFPKPKLMQLGAGAFHIETGNVSDLPGLQDAARAGFLRNDRRSFDGSGAFHETYSTCAGEPVTLPRN